MDGQMDGRTDGQDRIGQFRCRVRRADTMNQRPSMQTNGKERSFLDVCLYACTYVPGLAWDVVRS